MKYLYRHYRTLYALSTGGITLGFLQAVEGIRFSDIWAQIIAQFLSLLVALFFGGTTA